MNLYRPVRTAPITQPFRKAKAFDRGHPGVDFGGDKMPVFAAQAGMVRLVKYDLRVNSFGTHVRIEHEIDGERRQTLYAHLEKAYVVPGQAVTAGQLIGLSGSSGGTGPHLHFGLYNNHGPWAAPIDPGKFAELHAEIDPVVSVIVCPSCGHTWERGGDE